MIIIHCIAALVFVLFILGRRNFFEGMYCIAMALMCGIRSEYQDYNCDMKDLIIASCAWFIIGMITLIKWNDGRKLQDSATS